MGKLVFIQNDRVLTDSLTVAEVFEKEHKRVLQDIRELGCSQEFREHNIVLTSYKTLQNKELPKYLITQDGFALLAMGYTGQKAMEFKEDYIKAFREMESQIKSQIQVPQSFAEALRLAADLEEERQKLLPKAETYDRFISGENVQKMNDVAKILGWGRNKLFAELRERKIFMSNNVPLQRYIDAGYFVVKETPITMGDTGINKPQTYATAKGVEWLSKKFERVMV